MSRAGELSGPHGCPKHGPNEIVRVKDGESTRLRCKACGRAYAALGYKRNHKVVNERNRVWRSENAEQVREYHANHLQSHLEEHRNYQAKRRAQKLGATIEYVDALVLLEMDDGVCGICGKDVDPLAFDIDHITPLSRGGEHSYINTQAAHPSCNRRKGNSNF